MQVKNLENAAEQQRSIAKGAVKTPGDSGQAAEHELCLGYLGPTGTFSEEAACFYWQKKYSALGKTCHLAEHCSLEEIFRGVQEGRLQEGVVPVENSTEGSVTAVLDLLAGPFRLEVRGEVVLPITHALMVPRGVRLEEVEQVISHPQALAQCREFLLENLPQAVLKETSSTAAAARLVAGSGKPWAALGARRAAARYGLEVLREAANDCAENMTRFWVVGKREEGRLNAADSSRGEYYAAEDEIAYPKTSIIFALRDRPGALYEILREFAERSINLTRIESRPARKRLGDYLFFVDFEGSLQQTEIQEALRGVERLTLGFRILGSYPVWRAEATRQNRGQAG